MNPTNVTATIATLLASLPGMIMALIGTLRSASLVEDSSVTEWGVVVAITLPFLVALATYRPASAGAPVGGGPSGETES